MPITFLDAGVGTAVGGLSGLVWGATKTEEGHAKLVSMRLQGDYIEGTRNAS